MAHGPRKKPFDFGGNPDHVRLGLELRLAGGRDIPAIRDMFYPAVVSK